MAGSEGLERSPWRRLGSFFFGYDYFIAHRHADGKEYAAALYRQLSAPGRGFECFLDTHHYPAGGNLRGLQTRALRQSSRLIVVVSPSCHAARPEGEHDYLLSEIREFSSHADRDQITPIGTADTLSAIRHSGSLILAHIPHLPDDICLLESPEAFTAAEPVPSEDVVQKLLNDFVEQRRSARRERWLRVVVAALSLLLVLATAAAGLAYTQSEQRRALLVEASESDRATALRLGQTGSQEALSYAARSLRYHPDNRHASSLLQSVLLWDNRSVLPTDVFPIAGPLRSVALAPSGEFVVAVGEDGNATRYDTPEGGGCTPAFTLPLPIAPSTVAISPDERWIALRALDFVWLLHADGGRKAGLPEKVDGLTDVAFAPDGAQFLLSTENGQLHRWELRQDAAPEPLPTTTFEEPLTCLAFSPAGRLLVGASTGVYFTGPAAAGGTDHGAELPSPVASASLSPTGEFWAARCEDGSCHFGRWAEPTSSPIASIKSESPLVFSPDGRYLATADYSQPLVFDLESGGARAEYQPAKHESSITSMTYSPDGQLLLTASREGFGQLWEQAPGRWRYLVDLNNPLVAAGFARNGRRAVTCSRSGNLAFWDTALQSALAVVLSAPSTAEAPEDAATALAAAFADTSDRLTAIFADGSLRRWRFLESLDPLPAGTLRRLTTSRIERAEFVGKDDRYAAIVDAGGTLAVWDLESQERVSAPLREGEVRAFDVDLGNRRIAIAAGFAAPSVFDFDGGLVMALPRAPRGTWSYRVRFVDGGSALAVSDGQEVTLASLPAGEARPGFRHVAAGAGASIKGLISDGGPTLAVVETAPTGNDSVTVYRLPGNEPLGQFVAQPGGGAGAIVPSPAGDCLVLSPHGQVELWDPRSLRPFGFVSAHSDGPASLSPDGRFLAAVGYDHELRLAETPITTTHASIPPEAARYLTGLDFGHGGVLSQIPLAERQTAGQVLRRHPTDGRIGELLRWRLGLMEGDPVSPALPVSRSSYAARLLASGNAELVQEATAIDPSHPLLAAALAGASPTPGTRRFHARRALEIAYPTPAAQVAAAEILQRAGWQDEAGALRARGHSDDGMGAPDTPATENNFPGFETRRLQAPPARDVEPARSRQ